MTSIRYELCFTGDHLIETYRRLRFVRRESLSYRLTRWAAYAVLIALMVVSFAEFSKQQNSPLVFLFLMVLLLLFFGDRLNDWLIRRKFKKSLLCNVDVAIEIAEQGFLGKDPYNQIEIAWPMFQRFRRFPDGFLLSSQTHHYWLPDSALVAGTVDELDSLLSESVCEHKKEQKKQ